MLPKMQDFPFWMTGGLGGFFPGPESHLKRRAPKEEGESDSGSVVLVDEVESVESILSDYKADETSTRRSSLDSTSTNATMRIKLAGPLAPYVSESAVEYIASSSVYGKAIEYGIDTRVRDLAGWFGVDSWIRVEHEDCVEDGGCGEESEHENMGNECDHKEEVNEYDSVFDQESEDEEEDIEVPTNTPVNANTPEFLASQVEHFEHAIYESASKENLPGWAKTFAVDLIQHCADMAVECSALEEEKQNYVSEEERCVKTDEQQEVIIEKKVEGEEVFEVEIDQMQQEQLESIMHKGKTGHDSGVFNDEAGAVKVEESKVLLDFLSLLAESVEGSGDEISAIEDDGPSVVFEEVALVEEKAVYEELGNNVEIEVVKEDIGMFAYLPSSIYGIVKSVTDLGTTSAPSLRIVNVAEEVL